eukprot:5347899-Amphidinium_carterae.1
MTTNGFFLLFARKLLNGIGMHNFSSMHKAGGSTTPPLSNAMNRRPQQPASSQAGPEGHSTFSEFVRCPFIQ